MQDKRDATKTDTLAYITSCSEGARQTKQKQNKNEKKMNHSCCKRGNDCINNDFLRLSGIFTIPCIDNSVFS